MSEIAENVGGVEQRIRYEAKRAQVKSDKNVTVAGADRQGHG